MTLIQRFGSAANLNIHLHCLLLDGVYRLTDSGPVFQAIPAPSAEQLQTLLSRIVQRVMKSLTRKGALIEDKDSPTWLTPMPIPLWPRCKRPLAPTALRLASPEVPHSQRCVSAQGFSLHAETWCGPQQRQKLERLCRYITRPALGHKRLSRTRAGEVVLQLKTPYRDGTTHLIMTPLEFLQRLAALIPRPRLHLIRFHGVLAPNATLRSQIVPGEANQATDTANGDGDSLAPSTRARMSWAQ